MSSDERMPLASTTNNAVPLKDEKYYFESGDCVFLVEGVLFKARIHVARFHFCRDPSSAFANMFADAKGDPSEPIPLNDSVDNFRALCWAMYALPAEMCAIGTNPSSIPVKTYLNLAEIAHKYLLVDYESWAWNMARSIRNRCPHVSQNLHRRRTGAHARLGVALPVSGNRARAAEYGRARGRRKFQADIYWDLREKFLLGPVIASVQTGFAAFNLTQAQLNRLVWGHALISQCFRAPVLGMTLDSNCYSCLYSSSFGFNSCTTEWTNTAVNLHDPSSVMHAQRRFDDNSCIQKHLDHIWKEWDVQFTRSGADYFLGPAVDEKSE
ncbi:hypothetical protein HMN09_00992400 [Mycena chlorophos]|uniref:BTB domain-containing protein n=1 Tax=Mycena chlorophos TaxID=658473 RepID=A0A8H6SI88_MYCCL|nr:hypothetical protein HMN09_00992400 [Mycena chlorophos]